MSAMLKLFIKSLDHSKNSSQKTIENYEHRIGRAVEYREDPEVASITSLDILNFRMALTEQ